MAKKLLVVVLLAVSYLYGFNLVSAHELSKSGTIEGSLHISPNDEPIAQQLSKIEIEIIDTNKQFNFANCSCILQIDGPSGTAAELPLQSTGTIAETSYTFANDGVHKLILKGKVLGVGAATWEPFELTYSYEVKPSTEAIHPVSETDERDKSLSNGSTVGTLVLTILVIVSVFVLLKKKNHLKLN